ncbi:ATPase [Oceaniferula spumae]|uniref:ATPase n=1 Tax=Oceaniferula spumae TaxID=2979115 RepID=A0AAT9FPC0_9BACT
MSRAIQLTKIHALNWYGYRDSLPVKGNLVLAGVTGSGKSILMDLLMLVLVGPERAHHHFNRSATGSKSDRTIKSYCMLDTKREENGQPQYFHDKGVTTYIAAEFTWPDSSRVETWGLRFEFRSSGEDGGSPTPFFCPASLDKSDFLETADDGKLRPSPLGTFKRMIESHEGRLFSSSREYLRDMANPSHLNFNKDVLQRLLPSAMSFTNLKSFDDFCRQFVLPAEAVPVEDVVSSFRDFQSYERELTSLKNQLERLTHIREVHTTHEKAATDQQVATYLAAEFAHLHAEDVANTTRQRLDQLKEDNRADEERLEELDNLSRECRQRRESILATLNESSEGKLYQKLVNDLTELEGEIEVLRLKATRIDHQLQKRIQSARDWVKEIEQAPLEKTINTSEIDQAIETLQSCETKDSDSSLRLLAYAADDVVKSLRAAFDPSAAELRRLRSEKSDLDAKIEKLKNGVSPTQQPLLTALQAQLPILAQHKPPRALRDVCEVADEKWRVAAEVAFSEKFAVLVDPDHFDDARKILQRLPESERAKAGPQQLVDLSDSSTPSVLKGTLAETLETSDPDARRYIDSLFGEMVRVETADELTFHPSAIAANGIHRRDGAIISPAPYDDQPFIGEKGLKRQLEIKRQRLSEIEASLRRLEPLEREVERLIQARTTEIPQHHDILNDLVRVEDLPAKQAKYAQEMEKLEAIKNDEFDKLRFETEDLMDQIDEFSKETKTILKKGRISEIQRTEKDLKGLEEVASRREDDFSKTQLRIDIHKYLTRYNEWKGEAQEYTPALDVLATQFKLAASKAEIDATKAIGDLKLAMVEFKKAFAPKFDDLPEDGTDATAYVQRLEQIEHANIPEYEKKAVTERKRWEALFRTQVLSRMQQALKNVENIIRQLNHLLRRPIAHDRYKIEKIQNPDFKIYRELIDLNSLHHEDELFFSSMGDQLKDALADFLKTLVDNANSPEAARLLDYRQYFDYDLTVTDIRETDARPISVDKQSGKMSGGENQSPYFVAILASYLHAYNRHENRRKEPSLAIVPIDEAFSKLSGERIQNCIEAMSELDLQGMFSMSSGNIPYAFSQCDELIVISRKEERRGTRVGVRNVPVILYRNSPEGQEWMKEATVS